MWAAWKFCLNWESVLCKCKWATCGGEVNKLWAERWASLERERGAMHLNVISCHLKYSNSSLRSSYFGATLVNLLDLLRFLTGSNSLIIFTKFPFRKQGTVWKGKHFKYKDWVNKGQLECCFRRMQRLSISAFIETWMIIA